MENFDEGKKRKYSSDLLIDFIFKHKTFFLLLAVFFLGILLRYFAAINVEPNADEMVHGSHAIGIIASGFIGRVWQSILWSYLTDFFIHFFGVSMFSTRILSFLFGSLTLLLVYLLGKELFDKKVAILGAFLLAISPFHIIYTLIEMDLAAIFFILFAALLFLKRLKKDKKLSLLAGVFLGVAALIKTLALFFVPSFILFYLIYNKKIFSKKVFLEILKFCLIILLFFSPILIHNLLWYLDSQMVDAYFSQYFNVGKSREIFSSIQGISEGFKFNDFFVGVLDMVNYYFKFDGINFIFGSLGILLLFFKKNKLAYFFAMFQLIPFLLITFTNRLQTHYAIFPPIFALSSAYFLCTLFNKVSKKSSTKIFFYSFLLGIFVLNSLVFLPYIGSQTAMTPLRSYFASNQLEQNSLVIADARIYRGRIMWSLIDKNYLESSYFPQIMEENFNLPSDQKIVYNVYFIECVPDDCGWGTIKDQPQFNQSTESIVDLFKQQALLIKTIQGGGSPLVDSSKDYFKIYKSQIYLHPFLMKEIKSTQNFFYYPANYSPKTKAIDYYEVNGFFPVVLFLVAKILIWISLFWCIFSIFFLFYLVYKEESKK